MTRRLYFEDAYQTEFEASVKRRLVWEGKPALVLDQTCFYPSAGGQGRDRGLLNDVPVIDVIVRDEEIVHVIDGEVTVDAVRGRIDWKRRFDFMQQHTGQHVLSQSFLRTIEAETASSHLGDEVSTLEIRCEDLTAEEAAAVEDCANLAIHENREVRTYFVPWGEIHTVPFRRVPPRKDQVRVVEVSGFDHAACGGTHCRRTGEIGVVKIGRWEKIRNHVRLEFLCGGRALREYRWKSRTMESLADLYSAKGSDVLDLVTKQSEEIKTLRRHLRELMERSLTFEGKDLLVAAQTYHGIKIVKAVYDRRPADDMRVLASKMIDAERSVVLLGSREKKGLLVFACSPGIPLRMNDLVKMGCEIIGGRGGGSAELAFGGGPRTDRVEEAVEAAYRDVVESDDLAS